MSKAPLVLISAERGIPKSELDKLARQTGLKLLTPRSPPDYLLHLAHEHLELRKPAYNDKDKNRPPRFTAIFADFLSGKARHRRLHGGGKGQDIARAVGLNKMKSPTVLDLTAGLGRDAFVLASLGCLVTLVERNPVVLALLNDALNRARLSADRDLQSILGRMTLLEDDACHVLDRFINQDAETLEKPDVIYLDPMFPEREKSAGVKKEMQFFHDIVGNDADAETLLLESLKRAEKRIVVKRPRLASRLTETIEPAFVISGKSTRYDVYLPASVTSRPAKKA